MWLSKPGSVLLTGIGEADNMLTALTTDNGPTYLSTEDIICISPPFQKGSRPEARTIHLRGGHRIFIQNSDENRVKLAHLIPDDAPMLAASIKVKAKPGRKPKAKTPATRYPQGTQESAE